MLTNSFLCAGRLSPSWDPFWTPSRRLPTPPPTPKVRSGQAHFWHICQRQWNYSFHTRGNKSVTIDKFDVIDCWGWSSEKTTQFWNRLSLEVWISPSRLLGRSFRKRRLTTVSVSTPPLYFPECGYKTRPRALVASARASGKTQIFIASLVLLQRKTSWP